MLVLVLMCMFVLMLMLVLMLMFMLVLVLMLYNRTIRGFVVVDPAACHADHPGGGGEGLPRCH